MKVIGLRAALLVFMLISHMNPLSAADIAFTATVDENKVGVGERFTLSFKLENAGMGGGENLKLPDLGDFYILTGPNQSSSVQFINGRMSSSVSYQYLLQPKRTGSFTIGSASIDVDEKTYSSRPIEIEVVAGQQTPQDPKQSESQPSTVEDEIAGNLFLKAIIDMDHVVQGEQVNLTYKIYTRVNVSDYALHKVPAYTGFWAEDVQAKDDLPITTEVIDGREFRVGTIKRVALFPTRSGELEISPLEVETAIQVRRSRRRDPFDSIFDDPFDSFFRDPFGRTVKYMLVSNPLTIRVDPLPDGAPTDFNGAVGSLRMEVSLDKSVSEINDPINLKVSLTGKGNIKLLEAPEFMVPSGIESYPPKVTDQVDRVDGAIAGMKTFEYLMIPRSPGRFRIDPITYSYFDPTGGKYVTLRSNAFDIEIEAGEEMASAISSGAVRRDVEILARDIRFIHLADLDLVRHGDYPFTRPSFIALVMISFAAFLGVLVYGKKIQRSRDDISLYRQNRAMKEARKRFKRASEAVRGGNAGTFYPILSQAVWGYLGDRLNIEPGNYSLECVSEALTGCGVESDLVRRLRQVLESCSMANYGPGSSEVTSMGESLDRAKTVIDELERVLR
jgi:hypothetical protein